MRVKCGWCGCHLKGNPQSRVISHGMCALCFEKQMALVGAVTRVLEEQTVTPMIDEKLLDEFRGSRWCEWCGMPAHTHAHHIHSRGAGRLDVRINLVALCPTCHAGAHNIAGSREKLIDVAAKREGITPEVLVETIWKLRRGES